MKANYEERNKKQEVRFKKQESRNKIKNSKNNDFEISTVNNRFFILKNDM